MRSSFRDGICLLVTGVILAGCDLTDRRTKPEVACFNNLRQIDAAEQQWALEHGKSTNDTPTLQDVTTYLRSMPKCPSGGAYALARVGEPPSCSIPDHAEAYRTNRPAAWSPTH